MTSLERHGQLPQRVGAPKRGQRKPPPVHREAELEAAADAAKGAPGSAEEARSWIAERRIVEIECVVPDQAGVARGKIMPASKFLAESRMALPSSIFMQTIEGEYPEESGGFRYDPADGDLELRPDFSTLRLVPWAVDPTAQVIHDAYTRDGKPFDTAPRQLLRRVLGCYAERGLRPVVAPELEFYLVKKNIDPDYPLEPPVGRSGRAETGRRPYSISAVNEFDELFEMIYDFAERQNLEVDTLTHEEGAGQIEINLRHGDPLWLADQVFLLKRTIREAALSQDIYATFMAKPIAAEPGSAMHLHQSLFNLETGRPVFTAEDGGATPEFHSFIAGQQTYLPAVLCMLAPYVNSFRRLMRNTIAPANVLWGYDTRTTGLRVPPSNPANRRVENRIPSSDANPYLAIAASLACGLLGMDAKLVPSPPVTSVPERLAASDHGLPASLLEAVDRLDACAPVAELLGRHFIATYVAIKRAEFETFMRVISPWEREYLLLNV